MAKRVSRVTSTKRAAKKTAAAGVASRQPRHPSHTRATAWQLALERNLRAEGYSPKEARELVEIAAS